MPFALPQQVTRQWVECYFTVESSDVHNAILIKHRRSGMPLERNKEPTGWSGKFTFTQALIYRHPLLPTGIPKVKGFGIKSGTDDFYKRYQDLTSIHNAKNVMTVGFSKLCGEGTKAYHPSFNK
jgi:hypothetical protein